MSFLTASEVFYLRLDHFLDWISSWKIRSEKLVNNFGPKDWNWITHLSGLFFIIHLMLTHWWFDQTLKCLHNFFYKSIDEQQQRSLSGVHTSWTKCIENVFLSASSWRPPRYVHVCLTSVVFLRWLCAAESGDGKRLYLFSVYVSQTQPTGWMLVILTHLLCYPSVHRDTMALASVRPLCALGRQTRQHVDSAASPMLLCALLKEILRF